MIFLIQAYVSAEFNNNDEIIPLPSDLRDRIVKRAGDDTNCGKAIQRLVNKLDKVRDKFEQSKKDKKKNLSYIESLYNRVKGSIKLNKNLPPFYANTGLGVDQAADGVRDGLEG